MGLTINFYNREKEQDIRDTIRQARRNQGYTQSYVAECIQMSTRQYVKYENGDLDIRGISFQQGVNLCELLHIQIYELIIPLEERMKELNGTLVL